MKKVLFVVNSLPGGGVEQSLLNVIESLPERCEASVLSLYRSESIYQKRIAQKTDLDYLLSGISGCRLLQSVWYRLMDNRIAMGLRFRRYMKKLRPDLVIAFADGQSVNLVSSIKIPNCRRIAWVHTDFLGSKYSGESLDRIKRRYKILDEVVFVANALESKFKRAFGLSNTRVIHNTIDLDQVISMSEDSEPDSVDNRRPVEFVAIGRLSPEKGFDRLIGSLSRMPESDMEQCRLTIVGEGPERERLQEMVKCNKLEDVVSLTGFLENPYKRLKRADVLLVPSRYEGFGFVVLEAMALGVPVVSTKTTGPSEILLQGELGGLVENRDDAFDEIFALAIRDKCKLEKDREKVKARVMDFSQEKLKDELDLLL